MIVRFVVLASLISLNVTAKEQEISDAPFDVTTKFLPPFFPKFNREEPLIEVRRNDDEGFNEVLEETKIETRRLPGFGEELSFPARKFPVYEKPSFISAQPQTFNHLNGADNGFSVFDSAEKLLSPCRQSLCDKTKFEPSLIKIALKLLESPLNVIDIFKAIAIDIIEKLRRKRVEIFNIPSELLLKPLRKIKDRLIVLELPDTRLIPLIRPGSIIHEWWTGLKNIFQLPLRLLFKLIGINFDGADIKELINVGTKIIKTLLRVIRILQYVIEGQPLIVIVKELAEIFEYLQITTGLKNLILWLGMSVGGDGRVIYPPNFAGPVPVHPDSQFSPHLSKLPPTNVDGFNLGQIIKSLLFDDKLRGMKFSGLPSLIPPLPSIKKPDDHMPDILPEKPGVHLPTPILGWPNNVPVPDPKPSPIPNSDLPFSSIPPSEPSGIPWAHTIKFPEIYPSEPSISPRPGLILPGSPSTSWPFPPKFSETIPKPWSGISGPPNTPWPPSIKFSETFFKPSSSSSSDLITPPSGTPSITWPPFIKYPEASSYPNTEIQGTPWSPTIQFSGSWPSPNLEMIVPPPGLPGISWPSSIKFPDVVLPEPSLAPGLILPPADQPISESWPNSGLVFPPPAPPKIPSLPSIKFPEIHSTSPPSINQGQGILPQETSGIPSPSFIKFTESGTPWRPPIKISGSPGIPWPPSIILPEIYSKSPPSPHPEVVLSKPLPGSNSLPELIFSLPGKQSISLPPSIKLPDNLISELVPSVNSGFSFSPSVPLSIPSLPSIQLPETYSKSQPSPNTGQAISPPGTSGIPWSLIKFPEQLTIPLPPSIAVPESLFPDSSLSPNSGQIPQYPGFLNIPWSSSIKTPEIPDIASPSLINSPSSNIGSSDILQPPSIGSLGLSTLLRPLPLPDWLLQSPQNLSPGPATSTNIIPGNDDNIITWVLRPIIDLLRHLEPIVPKRFNRIINAIINVHDNIFSKHSIFNVVRFILESLLNFSKLVAHFIKSLMTIALGNKFNLIDGIGKYPLSLTNTDVNNPFGPLSALSPNDDSNGCSCNKGS